MIISRDYKFEVNRGFFVFGFVFKIEEDFFGRVVVGGGGVGGIFWFGGMVFDDICRNRVIRWGIVFLFSV